jgi:hypothetical protein
MATVTVRIKHMTTPKNGAMKRTGYWAELLWLTPSPTQQVQHTYISTLS